MMNSPKLFDFDDSQSLADALSQRVISDLEAVLKVRESATLLLSGGSTPRLFFKTLSRIPFEWNRVKISLVDERMVPKDHPESNAAMIQRLLRQNEAAAAEFILMYEARMDAQNASKVCEQNFKTKLFPFDVIVLGMGNDGHTASLFPRNPSLKEALDPNNSALCISMTPQDAPHQRLSLTLSAILSAQHIYVHFEGEAKAKVYQEAMAGRDSHVMPIRAVLQQNQKEIKVFKR